MYCLLAKAATEAAAAPSLLLAHPGPGSLDSAVAIIPVLPMWLSVAPSLSSSGSPTTFTFDEDDILMGMASPHSRGMLDPGMEKQYSKHSSLEFHLSHLYNASIVLLEFSQQDPECVMAPDSKPWHPFASEGDYIFAMITVEAGLSSTQVDSLLTLVHHCRESILSTRAHFWSFHCTLDPNQATLAPWVKLGPSFQQETSRSSVTTNASTQFLEFEITAPYKGEDMMFPVYVCTLWDWALDLLQNPFLTPHFIWDAQQLFKHDGKKYECFYTEPWMGDHWWDIQGYPMVVHCANLPIHIHNGEQYGGRWIVGWLLIVPELVKEERKTSYVNFKHMVWHKAFFKLLEKLCDDPHTRHKKQMPLPILPGPFGKTLGLIEDIQNAYYSAAQRGADNIHGQENVFWTVEHSEPEQAASFEPLHSLHGGVGGKHMHEELKIVVSELGHDFETKLEEQVSAFPHWHGLMHFDTVIHITFSDANKMRDMSRQCFYAALNILMVTSSPASYLQLDTLIGLDVHTEMTICMIENELLLFRDELKAHIDAENDSEHTDLVRDGRNNEDDCEMFEGNTKLGAPQQPASLSEVETSHGDDKAFDGFCWVLETFLNTCLPTYGYPLDEWI
ncbi:hypothetical protein EDC04DRAFT_2601243 [Pisolithus marmoratus]|nr:hypothetical protein EDC04DRAFT_2601243 [Pisolithus marmoratus]